MKKLYPFILSFILFACNSQTENNNPTHDTLINQDEVVTNDSESDNADMLPEDFRTELRPGKADWSADNSYTDTLEFIEFNDEYDYAYTVFKTHAGTDVQMNNSNVIDNYYRNRNFAVTWKVGKFYEAGEGESVYYKEQVTGLTMLMSSFSFEKFLRSFVADYRKGDDAAIKKYIHKNVPYVSATNPGAYCVMGESYPERRKDFTGNNFIISCQKPEGDFCEGYPNAKDGLYYEFFGEGDLPHYSDMTEDGGDRSPYIDEDVGYYYYAKVIVIKDGYYSRALYFFNDRDNWYFWIEDLCDCSA